MTSIEQDIKSAMLSAIVKKVSSRDVSHSYISKCVYQSDKQTTLVRRILVGEVDASIATLEKFADAVSIKFHVEITSEGAPV